MLLHVRAYHHACIHHCYATSACRLCIDYIQQQCVCVFVPFILATSPSDEGETCHSAVYLEDYTDITRTQLIGQRHISPWYVVVRPRYTLLSRLPKMLLQSLFLSRMNEPYLKRNWKISAVSTTVWMVETQLCKLRDTWNTNNPSCWRTPGCQVSGLRTNIKHRITSLDININTSTRTVTC